MFAPKVLPPPPHENRVVCCCGLSSCLPGTCPNPTNPPPKETCTQTHQLQSIKTLKAWGGGAPNPPASKQEDKTEKGFLSKSLLVLIVGCLTFPKQPFFSPLGFIEVSFDLKKQTTTKTTCFCPSLGLQDNGDILTTCVSKVSRGCNTMVIF